VIRHARYVVERPTLVLASAVAATLACEYLRETVRVLPGFPLQVAVSATALALVWTERERLTLPMLLVLSTILQAGWLLVRAHAAFTSDEPTFVYAPTGDTLLHGAYPASEYPVGAVLLFAVEAALGGGQTHGVHALLMILFQLAAVAAVWSLPTPWSHWFAAFVAVWPVNAWFWEWRFDLAPAGLLAVGLALSARRRWVLAGIAFGLGFTVKWTPGLAVLPVLSYLLVAGATRAASRLAASAAATVLLVYIPFLLWRPAEVMAAYRRQGGRAITDESLWHLPLRLLGLEDVPATVRPTFQPVGAPGWANVGAIVVQAAALALLVALGARARGLRAAIALGALMPVVFLLSNRVFSVQFFVLLEIALAAAAALVLTNRRSVAAATLAIAAATIANALILPVPLNDSQLWPIMSALRFGLTIAVVVWLAAICVRPEIGAVNGRPASELPGHAVPP
jgi:hypothetical protein